MRQRQEMSRWRTAEGEQTLAVFLVGGAAAVLLACAIAWGAVDFAAWLLR